jgi:Ca-activated chloride channel family protein
MAYTLARNHFMKNGNNRVILATDGDFNVGSKTETELEELITQQRESGIYLTCIGVGMGNYKDSKIQALAKKGNGNYAYFDSFREAEKILLTEFTQTLYAVADDVQLNISFNPELVKEYRLIGFDNKVGAITDTLSVVEGGEIGSGYSVMVVFEIEPTLINIDGLHDPDEKLSLAELQLNYKQPASGEPGKFIYNAPFRFTGYYDVEKCYRFSAAVIMFGSLLKGSPYAKNINWQEVLSLAMESAWPEDASQQEFIAMVQQAKMMYSKQKKRKKDVSGGN